MPPAPTNNQAPTTDFGTAYSELGVAYDPQVATVNTQLAALPGQQQTQQTQLDQGKANAFTNNSLTANARGLMYSGYTPVQNAAYTTNTYTPAVTKLNTDFTDQKQTLQDKITSINQQRSNDAESLVQSTQAERAKEAATAARATAKTSSTSQAAADKAASANYVQGKQGQYMFVDNSGKSINLQKYVSNTGGDINTVLGLLQGGTSYDKNIYNKVLAAKPGNATAALNLIRQLDTKKAYGF